MIKVSSLKKNQKNPRQIHGHKLDLLKKSVTEFDKMMELRPIIVDENNVVLGGNMRLAAIKALGHKEIPDEWVKRADDLTDAEKREFIIKDNAGFGEWDWDVIANEWSDEPLADWGLDVPGFEAVEEVGEADAEPQIDKAAELNKKWKVKSGDLWQIGGHRLLCGDSTSFDTVERLLNGTTPQMLLTDPPYGMDAVKNSGVLKDKYQDVIGDDSTTTALNAFALAQTLGITSQIWWGANYYANALPNSACWLVWDKNNGSSDQMDCELAWSNLQGVTRQFTEASEKTNRFHPTQKPASLAAWCIATFAATADTVLDLFAGAGWSVVACQNLKRQAFAVEMSPEYCAVILERMATAFPDIEIKRIDG